MPNNTSGIEMPNAAYFDVATFTRISTLQNSAASDITVLQYLQRAAAKGMLPPKEQLKEQEWLRALAEEDDFQRLWDE